MSLTLTLKWTASLCQVEDMTRGSKHKSGWSSGWKKVTKSFQSKDQHDYTVKAFVTEHNVKTETLPLPRIKIAEQATSDVPSLPSLKSSKSETLLPKAPKPELTTVLRKADSLPVSTPFTAKSKPTEAAPPVVVTPIVSVKVDSSSVVEAQPTKDFPKAASETTKGADSTPASTSTRPKRETPTETTQNHKDRRKEAETNATVSNHRKRRQYRSTSPNYVRRHRHHSVDSNTASVTTSVTTSSSYTSTTSTSVSSHSSHGHGHRHSRRSNPRRQRTTHNPRPLSSERTHQNPSYQSSEHSHRKHCRKEGSSEYHSHQSSQQNYSSHKEHHSVDSQHPRQSHKDPSHHRGAPPIHRKHGHLKEDSSKLPHHRHHRHHHREILSNSDSSSDAGARRHR